MSFINSCFTPSELIFLNGDKFAPESSKGDHFQLLTSDIVVSGPYLVNMMVAAAVLANEQMGALQLELNKEKGLLGLGSARNLLVTAVGQPPNWPGYTLEAAIPYLASQIGPYRGRNTLYAILLNVVTEDIPHYWKKIIEMVEWGLASSNWLMPVEGNAASAFSIPFICPAKVKELATQQPLDPLRKLLSECKKNRPEVWTVMMSEIEHAGRDRSTG